MSARVRADVRPRGLSVVVADGAAPFAIATADAGPASYWHKRASGIDPPRMIVEEYLPLLVDRGLTVDPRATSEGS